MFTFKTWYDGTKIFLFEYLACQVKSFEPDRIFFIPDHPYRSNVKGIAYNEKNPNNDETISRATQLFIYQAATNATAQGSKPAVTTVGTAWTVTES